MRRRDPTEQPGLSYHRQGPGPVLIAAAVAAAAAIGFATTPAHETHTATVKLTNPTNLIATLRHH